VEELKLEDEKGELLCNHVNPLSNLIFRININLRRVRIFMRKELTEILSIRAFQQAGQQQLGLPAEPGRGSEEGEEGGGRRVPRGGGRGGGRVGGR
jgi:hypothetical protein